MPRALTEFQRGEVQPCLKDGQTLCPDWCIWVCGACGKTSRTRYGFVRREPSPENERKWTSVLPDDTDVASPGWDESCMMNAVLCWKVSGPSWEAVDAEQKA